jgi:hypothetical protein
MRPKFSINGNKTRPIRIRENSFLARIAALQLQSQQCAIVWKNTIHLHGCSRIDFLQHPAWLKHEYCHVQQWRREGTFRFLFQYIVYSFRYGYQQNPYEIEARNAEKNPFALSWSIFN